jgi:hypothetical protein
VGVLVEHSTVEVDRRHVAREAPANSREVLESSVR